MIYGGNEIRRKEKQRAVETNRIMNFKRVMGGKKERTPLFTVIRIFFLFYIDAADSNFRIPTNLPAIHRH